MQELRLALTVADLDEALAVYRDALGLPVEAVYEQDGGRVVVLAAGRATIELLDERQAAYVDHVEVGRRVAPPIRVALQVRDSAATSQRLEAAGARVIAGPVTAPWGDRSVRLETPGPVQLTLFTPPPG